MRITVELFNHLRGKAAAPFGRGVVPLELPEGATAADLAARIGLPEKTPFVLLADGRALAPGDPLHDGAEVVLFPPLEGG